MNLSLIASHFPILIILLPLFGALFCVLIPSRRASHAFAMLGVVGVFAIAIVLLNGVWQGHVYAYHLGGWVAPIGIELRIDPLNAPILLLVSAIGLCIVPYAVQSTAVELSHKRHPFFFALLLLIFTGLLGVSITGDAFNLFVFLEIASLGTYPLVALGGAGGAGNDRRALSSAFNYLVMGTVGATFYLTGLGLLYMQTGTLNMADLSLRIAPLMDLRSVQAGCGFVLVGLALKFAIFPLHGWLPNAYAYAPSALSAFLAAVSTKVAFYAFLRFLFIIFGFDSQLSEFAAQAIFLPLAVLSIFVGSAVAFFQVNVKRMLAYSSVAQIGYILLGASLGSAKGISAGLVHLLNHGLMKGALFMAIGAVAYRLGTTRLDKLAGLGKHMPYTMAAFVIAGLSLIGVPLTSGFISKWLLLTAAFEQDTVISGLTVVTLIAGSLFALAYIGRVVEAAYFRVAPEDAPKPNEAPLMLLVPLWCLVIATLYFGIDARLPIALSQTAAEFIMGVSVP